MIEWVLNCVVFLKGDLLEMYCGVGNFLIFFVFYFDNVIGIEIVKFLV